VLLEQGHDRRKIVVAFRGQKDPRGLKPCRDRCLRVSGFLELVALMKEKESLVRSERRRAVIRRGGFFGLSFPVIQMTFNIGKKRRRFDGFPFDR
jgi:hypothetical protein